jgi:hypothetical protein
MAFTPEHSSRVLVAESGTSIGLSHCSFPDGGTAFVDTAREHSNLTKLSLCVRLPFEDSFFVWCLDHLKLEYLGLSYIALHGESCRAVVVAEIDYLNLECCQFEDEEAVQILVDNFRAERGQKGLSLYLNPFDFLEMLTTFVNALRGNTYLEQLDLECLDINNCSFQALVSALPENRELTHLGLQYCTVDDRCWVKLVGAIAEHPSLRTLSCEEIEDENEDRFLERHDLFMRLLACLLKTNKWMISKF